jgi:hypothetical protein
MATDKFGKEHAFDLLFQNKLPKTFGLTNGFYSVEAYSGTDTNGDKLAIKPVFCRKLMTRLCDPNYQPKNPSGTIQAIVVEANSASVKVIKDGDQVTHQVPILCADCSVNQSFQK